MSGPPNPREKPLRTAEPPIAVGELVADKYRIERILGMGGMGVVVAVTHIHLGEPYALKFLRGSVTNDTVERFLREARATVRIKSEHIVRVSDVSQLANGTPYIVMEYLSGFDLAQLLQERGPLAVVDAVDYIVQACAGIGEAHANGIVHRDLKPSNLFLTTRSDGTALIKVLDFGISKISVDAGSPSMTATQEVFGSPAYMPPEQIRSAKNVDARSDVWALGVILHELLTGALPFDGRTPSALLAAVCADRPKSARANRADVSEPLDAIVRRCLEKAPANRFASVAELAVALAPFATAESAALAERLRKRGSIVVATELRAALPPSSASDFAMTEKQIERRQSSPLLVLACALAVAIGLAAFGSALYLRSSARHAREAAAISAMPAIAIPVATAPTADAAATVANLPPSSMPTTSAPARKRTRPSGPPSPTLPDCDPPYTIDSEGIKRPKARCLPP